MIFKVSGVFALVCLALALAAPSSELEQNIESNEILPQAPWERLARMLSSCAGAKDDMVSCLTIKGVTAVNRAARMQEVNLFSGVHFERDATAVREGKSLESETDIARSLPVNPAERSARLVSLVMDAAGNFLNSHNLQVKLAPEEVATAATTFNEARGKIKKLLGPILLGVGVKILAVVAIFGGGLVLLVTKALIVAKLAFVLASILGLQKLFSGGSGLLGKVGGSGSGASQGWTNNGGSGGGWSSGSGSGWSQQPQASASYPYARSYETQEAQNLAYNAQKPAQ